MATGRLEAMTGNWKRTSDGAADECSDEGFEALSAASPEGKGRLYCGAQEDVLDELDMAGKKTKARRGSRRMLLPANTGACVVKARWE